ncbi:glutamine amidotransferase [Fulvitalea axinellae]|uniref:Glutamine amidotransferase n=1 Tax=Fulvitalea axinellae TaxID=1182444 RepID=A0AAU9D8K7_9BACT|nr:glutamine amidotransferase [Fulvitalea axinellae]
MILVIDNYDSFTYNLVDYLEQSGARCKVLRNDCSLETMKGDYDGVVLSPGPGKPSDAGGLMEAVDYFHNRLPVLGICLGHQALGEYFGASVEKAIKPMHGKPSVIRHVGGPMFDGIPEKFEVIRYHSLVLKELPDSMTVTATTAEDEIMAVSHKSLPLNGLQFHPEAALTEHGLRLLSNWLSHYCKSR